MATVVNNTVLYNVDKSNEALRHARTYYAEWEDSHKRLYNVKFYLHKMSGIDKFMETESKLMSS